MSWALLVFWKTYPISRLNLKITLGSIAVGLLCLIAWILPYEHLIPADQLTTAYNPSAHFKNQLLVISLLTIRLIGASFTVPLMEELFIRGFLQRYLIKSDFQNVPIGTYTHFSFWTTTALFALTHGSEWHVALLAGVIFGAWYIFTKNLTAVILAHATTNFTLGLYVILSGKTHFW